jgi:hypothetical protein
MRVLALFLAALFAAPTVAAAGDRVVNPRLFDLAKEEILLAGPDDVDLIIDGYRFIAYADPPFYKGVEEQPRWVWLETEGGGIAKVDTEETGEKIYVIELKRVGYSWRAYIILPACVRGIFGRELVAGGKEIDAALCKAVRNGSAWVHAEDLR